MNLKVGKQQHKLHHHHESQVYETGVEEKESGFTSSAGNLRRQQAHASKIILTSQYGQGIL